MSPADSRPASVTAAAACFVLYGMAVVINALPAHDAMGSAEAGNLPRALLRLAGGCLVAWGLLRGTDWSRWLALALALLWLVGGLAPVVVLERGDLHWLPPSGKQFVLAASLVSLLLAVVLLLTPSARAFLRRPRA